jgi:hypothetical protein
MFNKKGKYLIALPEKALFDQLYLASKGTKSINFDEYNLKKIDLRIFSEICSKLNPGSSFKALCSHLVK